MADTALDAVDQQIGQRRRSFSCSFFWSCLTLWVISRVENVSKIILRKYL